MSGGARSWLFAPGNSEKLLSKVFHVGADAVVLDLEDAVPQHAKERARRMVAEVLGSNAAWVRINAPHTPEARADLAAVGALALGIRIPKVTSQADVAWVAERTGLPIACTIESAAGVMAAVEIAQSARVDHLVFGAADLAADLGIRLEPEPLLFARSAVVLASRAADIGAPLDGAYTGPDAGLSAAVSHAKRLGFGGKSAIRPHQVAVINEIFRPADEEVAWAEQVVAAFDAAGGAASRLSGGDMVDLAVVRRARQVLEQAAR